MLQTRASLRRAEEAVEALLPLAANEDMAQELRAIEIQCTHAAEKCKKIYDVVAGPAFKDDAKETS